MATTHVASTEAFRARESADVEWLTTAQAAKRISVSKEFVYDACAAGGLKHTRLRGRRNIRIRSNHLDEWMSESEVVNG
jgi:excisionase family DNA binding protein